MASSYFQRPIFYHGLPDIYGSSQITTFCSKLWTDSNAIPLLKTHTYSSCHNQTLHNLYFSGWISTRFFDGLLIIDFYTLSTHLDYQIIYRNPIPDHRCLTICAVEGHREASGSCSHWLHQSVVSQGTNRSVISAGLTANYSSCRLAG